MRILLLANNWVGWQIARCLRRAEEEVVGVVVHPPDRSKFRREILRECDVDPDRVFDGSALRRPEVIESITAIHPQVGISALFGYLLREEFLEATACGFINIHLGLLPYNRGAFPNVWSIIDGTPAGVTIHDVDAEIDTGAIISQREVPVQPVDTGETLYRKLERAAVALFEESWPLIRSGEAPRVPQDRDEGTRHRVRDVDRVDEIDLDRCYRAGDLIDVIRARTFSPYGGAYFGHRGRKVYVRMELAYEDELQAE